jgi:hypothetical protein
VGAKSNLGIGTLLVKERNPGFVGVQEPDYSSRDRLDLVIVEILTRGWNRVENVRIELRHHVRIDVVDRRVVGIEYECINFLWLVHTRNTGRHKVLVRNRIWRCIGDVALDNTDIPNDRAGYYLRSDVHRGCACSVASKHGIAVGYGLDDR